MFRSILSKKNNPVLPVNKPDQETPKEIRFDSISFLRQYSIWNSSPWLGSPFMAHDSVYETIDYLLNTDESQSQDHRAAEITFYSWLGKDEWLYAYQCPDIVEIHYTICGTFNDYNDYEYRIILSVRNATKISVISGDGIHGPRDTDPVVKTILYGIVTCEAKK